jgi:hypothetical protein
MDSSIEYWTRPRLGRILLRGILYAAAVLLLVLLAPGHDYVFVYQTF